MHVLVVDDDSSVRQVLVEMLHFWGFEAFGVVHGRAAVDYLGDAENDRPQLIILDGFMPIMNGEEFLRYRESVNELKTIPVIVFSGTLKELKCRTAQGYVDKPFVEELRPFVEKFCTRQP